MREVALVELQKRITDGDSKLKQQQALYEAVRADRNMYSKSLIEAQVRLEWLFCFHWLHWLQPGWGACSLCKM